MNHKLIATLSVALSSALVLQGCKMDSTNKLALGVGAIGAVNAIVSKNKEEKEQAEQAKIAEQQRIEDEKKEQERLAKEQERVAKVLKQEKNIKGNFGLTLGKVFDTKKCFRKTLKNNECQVSLNGNTFFEKAIVAFHPQHKKIWRITGETAVKHVKVPKGYKGGNTTLSERHAYVKYTAHKYNIEQGNLIVDGLKQANILNKDLELIYIDEEKLFDGPNKSIILKNVIVDTNTANEFMLNPYMKAKLSLSYIDKNLQKSTEEYNKVKHEEARSNKVKGNF